MSANRHQPDEGNVIMGGIMLANPALPKFNFIHTSCILWILYQLPLIFVDFFAVPELFTYRAYYGFYVFIMCIAAGFWLVCRISWQRGQLKTALLPAVFVFMLLLPRLVVLLLLPVLPRLPSMYWDGLIVRIIPALMIGVILLAWQYSWRTSMLLILGLIVTDVTIRQTAEPLISPSAAPPLFTSSLAIVALLIIGYFVSRLVDALREQQKTLAEANRHLAHYASTLEELAINRERNRIARELHDTLAHTLTGLSVQLETASAYWEVDPQVSRSILGKALNTTRAGLDETRRALTALRSSPLVDMGLKDALTRIANDAAEKAQLQVQVSISPQLALLSDQVEHSIYRIAQEAISNVVYHANAKTLRVQLVCEEMLLVLTIQDDGQGFVPRAQPGHFGMVGMQERAYLAGGELKIHSTPRQGTTVQFRVKPTSGEPAVAEG